MIKHTQAFKDLQELYQEAIKGEEKSLYQYFVYLNEITTIFQLNRRLNLDQSELKIIVDWNKQIMSSPNITNELKNRFSTVVSEFKQMVKIIKRSVVVGHKDKAPIFPSDKVSL